MSRFAPALRRVARELDLPPPVRAGILMEMAADLEAIFEHHRRSGASEEEAARQAEEAILGSPEVLRRLSRLHRDSWSGRSGEIGRRMHGGVDLLLLLLGVAPTLLIAGAVAARALSGPMANPLGCVLLGIGAAMSGVIAVEAIRSYGRLRVATRRIPLLLALSAAAPAIGALALAVGLHSAAELSAMGVPAEEARVLFAERAASDGALFLVGLLLGLAGTLSSFLLHGRATEITAREVDALLDGEGDRVVGSGRRDAIPLVRRRQA
jgi:hypothetical protein